MSVEDRVTKHAVAASTAVVPELRNFVGGEFVRGDIFFDDLSPVDGTIIARVSEAAPAIVDAAISAARQALRGEWGNAGVRQRAALLNKTADGIEARFDEFVQAESADTGKPVALASRLDVPRAAANFRVFADLIKTAPLEAFETETPDGKHALNYAVRRPVGVVGIVTPWNLPLLLMTWKVAPALACGNAVVVKPSERLGKDVGFYQDPYSEYGRLGNEMWRSIRLVVDTGVHYKHWTRQQMVDYFREHTAMDEPNIQTEVDRYIAWPGQALAYKLGQMEILELRDQAKQALGPRYDIRAFHDEVLDAGPLPLDVLHTRVTKWIADQRAGSVAQR